MGIPTYSLQTEVWVPADIDVVWAYGSNPENLAKITPGLYGVKVRDPKPQPVSGDLVIIEMNPVGIPLGLKWESRIHDVVSTGDKRQFVDIQEKGPFKVWKHEHLFERGGESLFGSRLNANIKPKERGAWVRDRVEYALPFSLLGNLGHQIFVRKALERMFYHRRQKLLEQFGR